MWLAPTFSFDDCSPPLFFRQTAAILKIAVKTRSGIHRKVGKPMDETRLRKKVKNAKRWNLIVFCLFGAMAVFAVAALCIYQFRHTYSPEKWQSDRENRYQFVDDMLEKAQLIGKSEAEVLELLGAEDLERDASFKRSKQPFPAETTLIYYLGVDFIDANWLIISLEKGVVVDYCMDVS